MEIRNLGASGLRVSAIGLGCNNFGGRIDQEATRKVIHKALDLGITLFDTADVYGERGGSETCMGQILGDAASDIVLATKFGMPMDDAGVKIGGSRRYIMSAVEDSLRRLRTDWIDLYQIHLPDPRTPIEETLRALDDLIRQGKVRYIGCSNFPAWQVADAQWTAKSCGLNAFISCQDEYSLVFAQARGGADAGDAQAAGSDCCHFPAGQRPADRQVPAQRAAARGHTSRQHAASGGSLPDRRNWEIAERLGDFADTRGHTMLELAFSWLLAQPPVSSVIAGATRPEQLEQNVKAGSWQLTADELAEIDRISGA